MKILLIVNLVLGVATAGGVTYLIVNQNSGPQMRGDGQMTPPQMNGDQMPNSDDVQQDGTTDTLYN